MNCNTQTRRRPQRTNAYYPHFGNIINELLNTAVGEVAQKTEKKSFTNPGTNIIEFDDHFVLEIALPGFGKEDVDITFDEDRLTVKAKEKEATETEVKEDEEQSMPKFRLREFNYKGFRKTFKIPETLDPDSIKATFEAGILSITVSRKKEAAPEAAKTITIK